MHSPLVEPFRYVACTCPPWILAEKCLLTPLFSLKFGFHVLLADSTTAFLLDPARTGSARLTYPDVCADLEADTKLAAPSHGFPC